MCNFAVIFEKRVQVCLFHGVCIANMAFPDVGAQCRSVHARRLLQPHLVSSSPGERTRRHEQEARERAACATRRLRLLWCVARGSRMDASDVLTRLPGTSTAPCESTSLDVKCSFEVGYSNQSRNMLASLEFENGCERFP